MMEPFQWLVEYSVWKLFIAHDKQSIHKKDYTRIMEGTIGMEYNRIKRFLELLDRTFQMERRYHFRHGMKTSDGFKNVQEITVAKESVRILTEFCIGHKKEFRI